MTTFLDTTPPPEPPGPTIHCAYCETRKPPYKGLMETYSGWFHISFENAHVDVCSTPCLAAWAVVRAQYDT